MNPVQQLLTDNIGLWTGADTARKSGRGRASGSAGTVYGIKKLRELILELAVRGKLVPQDDSDEPASALLERIREEKARLVVEGKIKKDKSLAEITDDEKPFALPHGWEWVKILSIAELITSGSRDWAQYLSEDGAKFITMGNLSRGSYDLRLENMRYVNAPKNGEGSRTKLEENDLLISITGDVGNLGRIPPNFGDAYINQHTCLLRFIPQCRNRYYPEVMRTPMAIAQFCAPQRGIKNSFRLGDVNEIILPLPPLAEQHRIVAKVDELMALCDRLEAGHIDAADAHEKLVTHLLATLTASQDSADFNAGWQRIAAHFDMLFTTEASIDALKQTLLQLAVMGKLVPQDPSDEPASALLERIQAEKARLVSEGKIKKDKPLAAISDDEKPFALPQGWSWVRSEYISIAIVDCPHSTPVFVSSGMLCIDTNSIKQGSLVTEKIRYVEMETFLIRNRRLAPAAGDIIFAREGSVGESLVIQKEMVCCLGQRVMLFRPCSNINPEYFRLALSEPGSLARILMLHKGIGARHVNVADMRAALIPLPPFSEQIRIIAKLDELMALCDRIQQRIVDAGALQRNLADAMVVQAVA